MMSIAKLRVPHDKLPVSNFQVMDAKTLNFKENSFDAVIDTFSLCVIDDPDAAVKEMARVIKPVSGR